MLPCTGLPTPSTGSRRWLTDAEFLDLIGLVNLIPSPNSTEMAIHIGRRRAGWAGFAAGGVAFILPAVLIVTRLAWVYTRFAATPQVAGLLYGVKPVVIALIAQALWSLTPKAVKCARTAVIGAAVLLLAARGGNEILLLFGGGPGNPEVDDRRLNTPTTGSRPCLSSSCSPLMP